MTTTSWRTRVYPVAVLVALAIAVTFAALMASGSNSPADVVGGDYPAFYGAGRIALDGDWDQLYDLDRQIDAQRDLYPAGDEESVWFFAYPPQVALAYAPLASLPYAASYLAHTLIAALALWASVLLARPMIPWLRGRVALAVAASMLFWPMFRAVTGGSNTTLTLFLIVAGWRLVHDGHPLVAGLVLSGLLYKPQFAVPIIGLYLVGRHGRVVLGSVAGSVLFVGTGVMLRGWGWMGEWIRAAVDFGAIDSEVNGHSSISIVGFTENIFGTGFSPAVATAWVIAAGVAVFLSWLWWRADRRDLAVLQAFTVPGILFLSPHAMSHDGALVVVTVAVAAATWAAASWRPWAAVIWLLGASQLGIRVLGFSPGFIMLIVLAAWLWIPLRDRGRWLGIGSTGESPVAVPDEPIVERTVR